MDNGVRTNLAVIATAGNKTVTVCGVHKYLEDLRADGAIEKVYTNQDGDATDVDLSEEGVAFVTEELGTADFEVSVVDAYDED